MIPLFSELKEALKTETQVKDRHMPYTVIKRRPFNYIWYKDDVEGKEVFGTAVPYDDVKEAKKAQKLLPPSFTIREGDRIWLVYNRLWMSISTAIDQMEKEWNSKLEQSAYQTKKQSDRVMDLYIEVTKALRSQFIDGAPFCDIEKSVVIDFSFKAKVINQMVVVGVGSPNFSDNVIKYTDIVSKLNRLLTKMKPVTETNPHSHGLILVDKTLTLYATTWSKSVTTLPSTLRNLQLLMLHHPHSLDGNERTRLAYNIATLSRDPSNKLIWNSDYANYINQHLKGWEDTVKNHSSLSAVFYYRNGNYMSHEIARFCQNSFKHYKDSNGKHILNMNSVYDLLCSLIDHLPHHLFFAYAKALASGYCHNFTQKDFLTCYI